MSITVVGSVALDTIETPFGSVRDTLGGAASYFSLAASRYDTVRLVGVIGDDIPTTALDPLRQREIDLRGVHTEPGVTFRWGGRYHLDMNTRETLFTELGVFADFHPIVPAEYLGSEVVFLANIIPAVQLDVLRQTAPANGTPPLRALDTMNLWISTARDALENVMRGVDIVIIAEEEARQFANVTNLRAAARAILSLGPRALVVKQGSYGALLFSADGSYFAAPAYPLDDVRDPTGAGDSFAGGFLGYLSQRLVATRTLTQSDYKRALIHGNILGSFACETFGVERLQSLTSADIAARYREFVSFTHFDESVFSSAQRDG